MSRTVTIVMYHYVRDLARSRYPAIKGLSLERFTRQLDHIQAHYTPVSVEDLIEAVESPATQLPPNAILLTFDDGYTDHFLNAFPMLDARGIRGCFFPPAQAVLEHTVLDVNKIQFVLAAMPDVPALLDQLFLDLEEFRSSFELKSREEYYALVTEVHRYDPHEVIVLKRLLQRELPGPVRNEVVRRLFARYVTADEAAFAVELYMSLEQIDCMRRHGMHIGSHGYAHAWLDSLTPAQQVDETDRALHFLNRFGVRPDNWTIGYPYGGYNQSLLDVLRPRGCQLGFTVEPRMANLDTDDRLALPRLDTNDLPS
ncbi:MAG: polysaccharide deacetylase family protein [Terracidiphilus sp.]